MRASEEKKSIQIFEHFARNITIWFDILLKYFWHL